MCTYRYLDRISENMNQFVFYFLRLTFHLVSHLSCELEIFWVAHNLVLRVLRKFLGYEIHFVK